nr:MAG: pirin family protein [Hyphomicrobiales bacterium]
MRTVSGETRDLGDGFSVSRVIPQAALRSLGPFVFFDYFGPAKFAPGRGMDVRPHPHIGLATISYLFDGMIMHRDSLDNKQAIAPGAVNWMTAGRGIIHSERTPPDTRASGHTLHGIQSWIGLPQADEETAPSFVHVGSGDLPSKTLAGASIKIIAGKAYGLEAPVPAFSPLFYVDAHLENGAALNLTDEYAERGAFIVGGEVEIGAARYKTGTMVQFEPNETATIHASRESRVVLVGGEPLDGPRHIWWNFVSSSKDRIARAKAEWRANPTGHIEGDDEFIPLPD